MDRDGGDAEPCEERAGGDEGDDGDRSIVRRDSRCTHHGDGCKRTQQGEGCEGQDQRERDAGHQGGDEPDLDTMSRNSGAVF